MKTLLDQPEVRQRQIEVERWARLRLSRADGLFAEEIAPTHGSGHRILSEAHRGEARDFGLGRLHAACEEVAARRRAALARQPAESASTEGGRWISLEPAVVDFCGLAAEPGFVDEADVPAWDLWVVVRRDGNCFVATAPRYANVLMAWVPSLLVAKFDGAVRCSVPRALEWVDVIEPKPGNAVDFGVGGRRGTWARIGAVLGLGRPGM